MDTIQYLVIEKLERPRYDGVKTVVWGRSDSFDDFKKICSFMLDSNSKTFEEFFVWIYQVDSQLNGSLKEISLIQFCKENNIISLRGVKPYD
jgi:hypothetical protein